MNIKIKQEPMIVKIRNAPVMVSIDMYECTLSELFICLKYIKSYDNNTINYYDYNYEMLHILNILVSSNILVKSEFKRLSHYKWVTNIYLNRGIKFDRFYNKIKELYSKENSINNEKYIVNINI